MTVIAKAIKGQEFLYNASSAHKVNSSKVDIVLKVLNNAKYDIKENEVWHKYEVDRYDRAYEYGSFQSFICGQSKIRECIK